MITAGSCEKVKFLQSVEDLDQLNKTLRTVISQMTFCTSNRLGPSMTTVQCTHHSSCRSGPPLGTPLGPPGPSPSAGPHARWCQPRTGSGSCSSSASPQFSWSQSVHRSHRSSRRWGSRGGPGHYPTGSYCLLKGDDEKAFEEVEHHRGRN